ncbi:MAG: cyanophycin synthetase, partial [Candidatus Andersenbacteria bacterium]|nr:cyanophycin synthetase [Candidatus Andersenbacteria bacterium]
GKLFFKDDIRKISKFTDKIKYPIVVKPYDGTHGNLVFIGIRNKEDCEKAVKKILKENEYVLIEKMFIGTEYRIFATRNKFIAATNRVPANIIGDGIHTVRDLVNIKNSDPRRGDDYDKALIKIKIDKNLLNNLKKQKLKLSSIIKNKKIVYLRNTSNLSTGGDSVDVTDQIHPDIKKIAVKAVRAIPGLAYAGVDFMTNKDISKKPTKNSYIIIEINSSPMISMHHSPYQGKSRNVAKEIIDILFPETKRKYV